MLPADEAAPDVTILRHLRLTVAQARNLAAGLERFAEGEHVPADQDAGRHYGMLLSLYRADIPALPDDPAGARAGDSSQPP